MNIRSGLSKWLKIPLILVLLLFVAVVVSELMVESYAADRVYNSVDDVPANKVGLLLGTSKKISGGDPNLYYQYRIDAAIELFNASKIAYILVSGDNGTVYYDEPTTIKKDLVAKGIPSERIYLDYAGFRTYDSVIRCKEVFQQDRFTVISQQFHNERALFIASMNGIDAIGYNARDVGEKFGLKVKIRERFARVKMMFDIILGAEPKFLGEKIEIK